MSAVSQPLVLHLNPPPSSFNRDGNGVQSFVHYLSYDSDFIFFFNGSVYL